MTAKTLRRCAPIEPDDGLLIGWRLDEAERSTPIGFAERGEAPNPDPRLEPIVYNGDQHIATLGKTGSGKGRGAIIPNLLHWRGPAIVIDPKGENARVTARYRREMGQSVHILDPFRVVTDTPDTLNPLDMFYFDRSEIDTDSETMTNIIQSGQRGTKEPFWDIVAGQAISAIIAYVAADAPEEQRHLGHVYELMFNEDVPYKLATLLDDGSVKSEFARRGIAAFISPEERLRSNIMTVAQSQVGFLGSEAARRAISSSSISIDSFIRGEPMTIYLVIPPERLESHGRLLGLWINFLMTAILQRTRRPKTQTLFMLDEAAQLGELPTLRQAMTLLRGYGLQTWTFWQNVSQIKRTYPLDWETMLDQTDVLQIFGASNYRYCSQVAELIGEPDGRRIMELTKDKQMLVHSTGQAFESLRPDYLDDDLFAGRFDENPMFSKGPER